MTKSKLRDPHSCLGGQIEATWQKNQFPSFKKNPEPFRARFANTMRNPFFYFAKYRPKHYKKNLNSKYIVL